VSQSSLVDHTSEIMQQMRTLQYLQSASQHQQVFFTPNNLLGHFQQPGDFFLKIGQSFLQIVLESKILIVSGLFLYPTVQGTPQYIYSNDQVMNISK